MRKTRNGMVIAVLVSALLGSFFAGRCLNEQEHIVSRSQRCNTLISFAIDKAEDLSDPDVMAAVISNVYAAYQFCDDPDGAAQLHDIWNTLIFEGESYLGREDLLVDQLNHVSAMVQAESS